MALAVLVPLVWLLILHLVSSYTPLSETALPLLSSPGETLDPHTGSLLSPILIPRVPGSEGSLKTLQHFTDFFTALSWDISYDNFTATTPTSANKPIPFVNFYATLDPPWKRNQNGEIGRLVLVAHYDSKITPDGFIGATDSAAPCAMLMHVAKTVDSAMRRKWKQMEDEGDEFEMEEEMGVMVLLLDGEEAFHSWTDTDSLYGARHLAETWDTTHHLPLSTYRTALSSISLFLLLDLLGASTPNVPSYFSSTHWAYQRLSSLESRLRSLGLLHTAATHKPFLPEHDKTVFPRGFMISDDHLPFMARGVEILHIIPTPFPRVWHTMDDDADHLDKDVVNDWAIIMQAFVVEWWELEHFLSKDGEGAGNLGARANKTRMKRDL